MPIETHLATLEDWTFRFLPPSQPSRRLLLLLHGWTGDENSMWVFARNFPRAAWLLAPRAPYPVPSSGYSWREHLETKHSLEDLRVSAASLLDFVQGWGIANQVDTDSFDVVGFSQGAALAGVFTLLYPGRISKLAMLAGFLPEGTETIQPEALPARIFITHGTQDMMVSIERARAARNFFEQCGAQVQFCESDVTHKVSAECLRALVGYLQD
jgi:phospholipase/carboxylesterase